MSSLPELSQELIDQIIDHAAHSGDWLGENLLQCALVNRSFHHRSQRYIFTSIVIRGDPERRMKKIFGLSDIIDRNPDIAHYIQELTLGYVNSDDWWPIHQDPIFVVVMKEISTADRPLRRLTISADGVSNEGFCYLPSPQILLNDFFQPFISPFITSLSLNQLRNIPIEVVENCVNLVDLELHQVTELTRISTGQRFEQPLKLQRLAHRLSRPALNRLLNLPTSNVLDSKIDLSQLKSLIVYTEESRDLEFEQQIIDTCRGSLEELYLISMPTVWSIPFRGFANLQDSPRLRLLHAQVLFPEDSLVSVCRTLSTIRASSLENLFIEARVAFYDLFEPQVVFDADWAALSSELVRIMSDGSRFEFKMTYMYQEPTMDVDLEEYQDLLHKRCQLVMDQIRTQKLKSLVDDPHLTIALSHALEIDRFSLFHDLASFFGPQDDNDIYE